MDIPACIYAEFCHLAHQSEILIDINFDHKIDFLLKMERQEQTNALENSFLAGKCDCLSLFEEENRLDGREIANFKYRKYDEDFNEDEPKAVFDFKRTLFHRRMLTDDQCSLSVLHVAYDRYQTFNFDLSDTRRGTIPIYSAVI